MSIAAHARQIGVPANTIYCRMLRLYGLKPWEEYTIKEIQAVSWPVKRKSAADISRECGVNQWTIYARLAGRSLDSLTDAEMAKIMKPAKRAMKRKRKNETPPKQTP